MRTNVRSHMTPALATVALALLAGCGGGSSGSGGKTAASTAPGSSTPPATTTAPATSAAKAAGYTGTSGAVAAGRALSGSIAAATSAVSGGIAAATSAGIAATTSAISGGIAAATSAAASTIGSAPGGSVASTIAAFAAPPTLKGTIPADPDTNFVGSLFFQGTRIEPGTSVVVGFGGATVAVLPGTVYSSETVGADAFFLAAGDYTFTLLAPTGVTSNAITVTVKAAAANGSWLTETPDVSMLFPPSFDTSFVGTVWIMGDHFVPGAMIHCARAGYPDAWFPLTFVNDRSLFWETATPLAGDMTLSVVNPTTLESTPLTVHVADVTATASSSVPGSVSPVGPAPRVLLGPTSCVSPFLGAEKIYGQDFQPGAVVVCVDSSGTATTTAAVFLSSDEVWWELVYPLSGTYEVLVRNPDGQSTKAFNFTVN